LCFTQVSTIIYLLEGLLESIPYEKKNSEVVENIFLFAVMWAFGGPMIVDKGGDFRKQFSEQFSTTFGQKFPKERPCFDYVWSCQDDCFVECKCLVPSSIHPVL